MICSKCSHTLPTGSAFCPYCGAKQNAAEFCPVCGAKLLERAAFCMKCGTDLKEKNAGSETQIVASGSTGEPFYKKWIAGHSQLAETKHITWISEFKGNYAVAADDKASGRELRPFLVRGENIAENVCYMSWTGANLANGVIEPEGDCFRNGSHFMSFILFRSNSMVSPEEYKRILYAFTGISQPYATSGIALLISRSGKIMFAGQYQENITGISDIFPLRVIGSKYCLYTQPEEYNRMTNRERYSSSADDIKAASQKIVDCETGTSVLDNVFVPKYEGDPSEYFVEYFHYSDRILDILHSPAERSRSRRILNRKTGKIYTVENDERYTTIRVGGRKNHDRYLMLKMSDIVTEPGTYGESEYGEFSLIDENDRAVIDLGRQDLQYLPEMIETEERLYISTHSSGGANASAGIRCYEKELSGQYTKTGEYLLETGGGFADGLVHIHTAGKTEPCSGIFTSKGNTYVTLLKERSDLSDEHDKCVLLDGSLNEIYSFNYRQHYGDQTPYGIHVFDDVICALSSEEDEYGDAKAVLKNVLTDEEIFSAEPSQLISNASAEFGRSRIRPRYEFGSYRAGGKIYFLIGKQNRGLGIMDFRGNIVIPVEKENYFIVSSGALGLIGEGSKYARLPENTFLIVLGSYDSDKYRVCGMDGNAVFEGSMEAMTARFS